MAITTFNFMTLANLTTYHGELTAWTQAQIAEATASGIKTVSISKDATSGVSTLHFYTVAEPVGEVQAAYSIPLPSDYYTEAEIDNFVQTINGNVQAAKDAADAAQEAADAAQADVDALSEKVGDIPVDAEGKAVADTVIEYVNKKTEGIATDAALAELQGSLAETQGEVDAIKADYLTSTDKSALETALEEAIAAEEGARAEQDEALAASIKAISDDYLKAADKTELSGKIDENTAAVGAEKERAEAKEAEIVASVTAVDEKADGIAEDLDAYIGTNDARVKAIEDDYLKAADKTALENADSAQVERIAALEGKIVNLTGAMHFEGVKQSVPTGDALSAYEAGDVIIVGEKEYVFDGTAFVEFGDVSAEGERIGALEGRMDTAEADIEAVEGRAEALEGRMDDAEDAIEANAGLIEGLDGRMDVVEAKFDNYSTTAQMNAAIKVETDRATEAEQALAKSVSDMDTAYKAADEALAKSVSDMDTAYKAADEAMSKSISDMDAAYKAADKKAVEDLTALVEAEAERATGVEGALTERVAALETVTHGVSAIADEAIRNLFKA